MSDDTLHAVRSPSGAKKRQLCPGSVVLEADRLDSVSRYAAEGTAAHQLLELCLNAGNGPEAYEGRVLSADGYDFDVDGDMIEHISAVIAYIHDLIYPAHGDVLLVEQKVPIGHISGEKDATGTADVVGIVDGGKRLVVVDLKYGMGVKVEIVKEVESPDGLETIREVNPQLVYYGAGALEEQGFLYDIEKVTLVIAQPRLEHFVEVDLTLDELAEEVTRLRNIEAQCDAADMAAMVCDPKTDAGWQEAYLKPGEEQCRFCKAKAICPALRGEVFDLVSPGTDATDFEDLTVDDRAAIQDHAVEAPGWLGEAMSKVGLVEDWCKSIRAELEAEVFAGATILAPDGVPYVIGMGRQGNRKWADEVEAAAAMRSARLKREVMFVDKLGSPTRLEKLLAKEKPRVWAKLAKLVIRADGKPSVMRADECKTPYVAEAQAEQFTDLSTEEPVEQSVSFEVLDTEDGDDLLGGALAVAEDDGGDLV